jgi:hypothetical protein
MSTSAEVDMPKGLWLYVHIGFAALILAVTYVTTYFAIQSRYRRECAIEYAIVEYNAGFSSGPRCELTRECREPKRFRDAFPLLTHTDFTVITEARVYQSASEHKFDYELLMQCRFLARVDLQQCEVTDADLDIISQLPHLKRLSLSATTTISDAQSKRLSERRPDLWIDK